MALMVGNKKIFISYCSVDGAYVDSLCEVLVKNQLEFWRDREMIDTGSCFMVEIPKAIEQSQCLILVLSENFVFSDIVQKELQFARDFNKKVFVYCIKNFLIEKSDLTMKFLFSSDQYCYDVNKLLEDVLKFLDAPRINVFSAKENSYFGGYVNVYNNEIFYFSSDNCLNNFNISTNKPTLFSRDCGSQLQFVQGCYYYAPIDNPKTYVRKKLFDRDYIKVLDRQVNCALAYNDTIFFLDEDNRICKVDYQFKRVIQIEGCGEATQIGLFYNELIYRQKGGDKAIYKLRDGNPVLLAPRSSSNFCINGRFLYYISDRSLFAYDFENRETQLLKNDINSRRIICSGDTIFFIVEVMENICSVDLRNIEKAPLVVSRSCGCESMQLASDMLFSKIRSKFFCINADGERRL